MLHIAKPQRSIHEEINHAKIIPGHILERQGMRVVWTKKGTF